MTKAIRVLLASLFLGTALLAVAQEPVRVQVPFEFHVNGQTLPAGTYTVKRVFELDERALAISGDSAKTPVTFLVNVASSHQVGSGFSFRRYGDVYFLAGVTTGVGRFSVPRSREERIAAVNGGINDVISGSK